MLELFDHPLSPYALKVRITLYEKGIDFTQHEILRESQREELVRVSPRLEVPALRDGETVVYDSRIICEYIEERWPEPPLLPRSPAERARVRALELSADTELDASVLVIALMKIFRPRLATSHPAAAAAAGEILARHQARLERQLSAGDYLAGGFTRADITTYPHIAFAAFLGHPPSAEHPRLAAWLERMQSRPSAKRATEEAMAAFAASSEIKDPFFSNDRLHWRSDRIEALLRVGLGPWLEEELRTGRGFLPPAP